VTSRVPRRTIPIAIGVAGAFLVAVPGRSRASGLGTRDAVKIVMLLLLAVVLLVGWLALNVAWDVGSFLVHVLLGLAVLAVVMHFVRGRFGRGSAPA
jgi:heme A synthase